MCIKITVVVELKCNVAILEALTKISVNVQLAVFAFINWKTGEVLQVFDQNSVDFIRLVYDFQEDLKNAHILDNRFPCTEQHSQEAYQSFHLNVLLSTDETCDEGFFFFLSD